MKHFEDEEESRRKRQPPAEFKRTQFGAPVHWTGGNARNARDVLMQASASQQQQPATGGPTCRVCAKPLFSSTTISCCCCTRCRRDICGQFNCLPQQCEKCLYVFCTQCSTANYRQSKTRMLCIDCDDKE